jgi:hypothetical protein
MVVVETVIVVVVIVSCGEDRVTKTKERISLFFFSCLSRFHKVVKLDLNSLSSCLTLTRVGLQV